MCYISICFDIVSKVCMQTKKCLAKAAAHLWNDTADGKMYGNISEQYWIYYGPLQSAKMK